MSDPATANPDSVVSQVTTPETLLAEKKGRGRPKGSEKTASTPVQPDSPYFGTKVPEHYLQEEKPQHREICLLASQGLTATEIAEKTGFSAVMVGNTLRQPWALKLIADTQKERIEAVSYVFKAAAVGSAKRLVQLAETASSEETKRKANLDVLEMLFGKAAQRIQVESTSPSELSEEELQKIVYPNGPPHNP